MQQSVSGDRVPGVAAALGYDVDVALVDPDDL
jgi:hypothetical protein